MAKASQFVVLAAAVLVCASLVGAQQPFFSVTHLDTVYNTNTQNTEFTYSFTTSGADMQHWVLGANCSSLPTLVSGQTWTPASTGVSGFKYPHGQVDLQTLQYTLLVTGKIGQGSVEWLAHGSGQTDTGNTAGPDCLASTAYPDMGQPIVEAVACDSEDAVTPASLPANVNYEKVPGACEHSYTLLKTTTSTTDGLTASRTDSINVSDDEKPSFQPITVENPVLHCTSELVVPDPANVTATDNCANVEATMCSEVTNGTCPGNYFITHTWTATDDCGNSKCLTQVITVQDITKPDLHGVPPSTSYECDPDQEETRLSLPHVTATDECNDCFTGPVSYTHMRVDGNCANTLTLERTWSVTDCCGNSNRAKQVIVISDNADPTLSFTNSEPDDTVTAECDDVPEPPAVTASDVCVNGAVDVTLQSHNTSGSCPGFYTITQTWEAVDPCGNDASIVKYISVTDETPPIFTPSSYEDISAQCGAIPAPPTPSATDNCGSVNITFSAHNETTNCDNEWDEVRVWTATDECGLTSTLTQTVHVVDTTPPTPDNLPSNQTQQCASLITPYVDGTATAVPDPNGCIAVLNITYNAINESHSCENRFTRLHTWEFKDCSHTVNEERYDFVYDETSPVFSDVPADTTHECTGIDPSDPTFPTATDNCDDSVIVSGSKIQEEKCGATLVQTWTWATEDQCSNANTAQTTVTVKDSTPPTMSGPSNLDAVECHAVPAVGTVTGSDDCSSVSITYNGEERSNGFCNNSYTLVRTWTATDACGLTSQHVQNIQVIDTTAPTLSGVPDSTEVDCGSVPEPADVCASDNCEGTTLNFTQSRVDGCGTGGYTLVRTWTVTDNCGNNDTGVQTVTVVDRTEPTFSGNPVDMTQECSATTEPETPDATDDCSALSVSSHHSNASGSCTSSTIRTIAFAATDDCSNRAWFNYTITILDTTDPELLNVPEATVDECSDISMPADVTARDNCDTSVAPVYSSSNTSLDAECPGVYTITRTWTTTDDCGNSRSDTQIITVADTTVPEWSSDLPRDTTVNCEAPGAAVLTATDLCDPDVTVTLDETTSGTCPEVITRKWVATDCASNSISFTQSITVQDINTPIISGVPADTTNQCDSVDAPADVCASDNCEHGVDLNFTQTREEGSCPFNYNLIRKWVAQDACTLTSTAYQTVVVEDTTVPTITSTTPTNKTFECNDATDIVAPTLNDNCGDVTRTAHHFNESRSCDQSWTERVNFRYEDQCANVAWVNWTRVFQDTVHPAASWSVSPADITVDTTATCDLPAAPTITLNDACDPGPEWNLSVTNESYICDYKFTTKRHWQWNDDCGNSASQTQLVTMTHSTNPTLICATCETMYVGNQECDQTFNEDELSAADACGVDLSSNIAYHSSQANGSCPQEYTINREWTVSDTCGLNTTITRSIVVVDTEAPVLNSTPQDFTTANVCSVDPPITVDTTDNCDETASVSVSNVTTTVCDFNFTVVYIWSASDACGNTASHSQTIKYINSDAPTLTEVNTQVNSECDTPVEVPAVSATDACSRPLEVTYSATNNTGDGCTNSWVEIRTWTATDDCGRTTSRIQTVTFSDSTPPVMSCPPAQEQTECGFVQPPEVLTATDNCGGATVSFAESRSNGSNCCTYDLERVWTATDACGHSVTCTKTIVVRDTIPPPIDIPGDVNADCHNVTVVPDITAREAPLAVAYCANNNATGECAPVSVPANYNHSELQANLASDLSVFIWQADDTAFIWAKLIDQLGHTFNLNITLAGRTTIAPTGFPVVDLDESCLVGAGIDQDHFKYYTSGSGNLSDTNSIEDFTVSGAQVGMSASNLGTSKGVLIQLSNGGVVRFVLEKADDLSSPCDVSSITWALPSLECGDGAEVSFTEERTNGSCIDAYQLKRTWTARDTSGNNVSASSIVSVTDTHAPVLSGNPPNDYTIACQENPAPNVTYTDLCDKTLNVALNEQKAPGRCRHDYMVSRLWSVSDDCGNTASVRQTVRVNDTTPPQLSEPPADGSSDCENPPTSSGLALSVSDDCVKEGMTISQTYSDSRAVGVSESCQTFDRTFTFNVADDCGNTDTKSYIVKVTDSTPPSLIGLPLSSSKTIECDEKPYIVPVNVSCSDDCGACNISENSQFADGWECSYPPSIIRTWVALDECNHGTTFSQSITVQDTTPPTFNDTPDDTTVECDNIPHPAVVNGTDNCDNSVQVTYDQKRLANGTICSYVLERTWTATDCAGNADSVVQSITVVDSAGPLFVVGEGGDNDASVLCGEVPKPPPQCAQDNCNAVTMVFTENRTDGSCPYQYTLNRRWVATDGCGNPSIVHQVITVDDQVEPTWSDPLPASSTQECDSTSDPTPPSGIDACGSVTVSTHHTSVNGSCAQALNKGYNWKLTDECDNAIWHNITVRIEDTNAPVFGDVPSQSTGECVAPTPTTPTVSDTCDDIPTVSHTSKNLSSSCSYDIPVEHTWTASDACGNVASTVVTMTAADTVAPELINVPAAITFECNAESFDVVSPTASDNCGLGENTVQHTNPAGVRVNGSCPDTYELVHTWTIQDECGSISSASMTVQIQDVTPPTFSSVPESSTEQCAPPTPSDPQATDNCDDQVSMSHVASAPVIGNCSYDQTITHTWTVEDDCGNSATVATDMFSLDTTAPVFSGVPAASTFQCQEQLPSDPGASDNCGLNDNSVQHTVLVGSRINGSCTHQYYVAHEWTIADECGNSNSVSMTLTVEDTNAPELQGVPAASTAQCEAPVPNTPSVTDVCDQDITVEHASSRVNGSCPNAYTIVHEWSVTDDCGNTASHSASMTSEDTSAPVLSTKPDHITVQCDAVPEATVVTATDNCDTVSVTYNFLEEGGNDCQHEYRILRSWVATDECGNSDSYTQSITVIDTTKPSISGVPDDTTYECDNVAIPAGVCASDNCANVSLSFNQDRSGDDCTYTLTRNWTATDECGNEYYQAQNVTVSDNTNPIWDQALPVDSTVECTVSFSQDIMTASDNCNPATVTASSIMAPGDCDDNYTRVYNWDADDSCSNTISHSQSVYVQDTVPPNVYPTPLCRIPRNYERVFTIPSATSTFFHGNDSCSETVILRITGCSSNQDSHYNLTYDGNFNSHCMYNNDTDELTIFGVWDWLDPNGRVFTITGEGEDECGHVTPSETIVWLPRDEDSTLSPSSYFDNQNECVLTDCEQTCPCGYNLPTCEESQSNLLKTVTYHESFTTSSPSALYGVDALTYPSRDVTTFVYTVAGSEQELAALAGGKITIGLDLRSHVFLFAGFGSVTSDNFGTGGTLASDSQFQLGFRQLPWEITYISGIHFTVPNEWDGKLWFVLAGTVGVAKDVTPVTLAPSQTITNVGGFNDYVVVSDEWQVCTKTVLLDGPGVVTGSTLQHKHGYVKVQGSDFGTDRAANLPLASVVVNLIFYPFGFPDTTGSFVIMRTMTDANGLYKFHNIPDIQGDLRVDISKTEGFLDQTVSTYGVPFYFSMDGFRFNSTHPFGNPINALTHGSQDTPTDANNFDLIFLSYPLEGENVYYPNEYHEWDKTFTGNSWSVRFWNYAFNAPSGFKELSSSFLTEVSTAANTRYLDCSPDGLENLVSGDPLDLHSKFAAVAFNRAAGRGMFLNLFPLERLWTAYAYRIACQTQPDSYDRASAAWFLGYILGAR